MIFSNIISRHETFEDNSIYVYDNLLKVLLLLDAFKVKLLVYSTFVCTSSTPT